MTFFKNQPKHYWAQLRNYWSQFETNQGLLLNTMNDLLNTMNEIKAKQSSLEVQYQELLNVVKSDFKELHRTHDIGYLAQATKANPAIDMSLSRISNMRFVDAIYEFELQHKGPQLRRTLEVQDTSFSRGERGTPADPACLINGHFKTMLKRYIFAGKVFGENKKVLDTCCGRGWGTYLLSMFAENVSAYDYDATLIEDCENYWGLENVTWKQGNALDSGLLDGEEFDLVTSMEALEHFHREDGAKYLHNSMARLKSGGHLVATSFFPKTRYQAENHASLDREDHHYLWTMAELKEELEPLVEEIRFIDQWMFIARKR